MNKLMLGLVLLCAFSVTATDVDAQTNTLKIATLAPEGSSWMDQMKAGADKISERTAGRVKIKFYGGGVMGNDKKVMRKIRNGQLHGGAFTAGSLVDRFAGLNLYGLPMMFSNLQEVDVARARFDSYIKDGLEQAGMVSFGLASGGFAQIMSNVPVRSVDDLKGKRVWVPEGDKISYAAMERFGLSPVTLPVTDVLTGLQTGLVDVIGSSAIGALVLQWHTKVTHVSTLPVSYLFGLLAIESTYFNALSSADQQVVREVFENVYAKLEVQNNIDNASALQALKSSGLTFVDPEPGFAAKLKGEARELWYELAKTPDVPLAPLQEMEALLEDYRSSTATAAP